MSFSSINVGVWTHGKFRPWDWFAFGLNFGLFITLQGTRVLRGLCDAQGELIKQYEMREMLRGQLQRHQRGVREVPMNDWRNS